MKWYDFSKLATDMTISEFLYNFFIILLFIIFVIWFIDCLSKAVLIKKANGNPFSAFIPFYSDYVLCKISGTNLIWFAIKYGLPFIVGMMAGLLDSIFEVLDELSILGSLGFTIILNASISHSFGKGIGTTICLIFFPHITRFVLAYKGKYLGPKGCNDFIFGKMKYGSTLKESYQHINDNPMGVYNYKEEINKKEKINYSFCPSCGNALTEYDRFCNKCGREI